MKTSNKENIFKPRKKPFNYNSRKFKRRMRRVEKECEKIRRRRKIDSSKLHIRYD